MNSDLHNPLDHFVIGSTLSPTKLAAQFERLGFKLRPQVDLSGAGRGLCNRIAYLSEDRYLELLCLTDASQPAYGLPAMLKRREGLVRVATATTDVESDKKRAIEAGWTVEGPHRHKVSMQLESHTLSGHFEVAHASHPATPNLGVYFTNYLERPDGTPWRVGKHLNGVIGASQVIVVGSAKQARPFQALVGGTSTVQACAQIDARAWQQLTGLPAEALIQQPYMAGIVFSVESLSETATWFKVQGIDCRHVGPYLYVPPSYAANTALLFETQQP